MRGFTTITTTVSLVMAALVLGCGNATRQQDTDTSLHREMELLASEHDLNAMLSRGAEGIVDWQLDTAAMEAELAAWREETAQLWAMAKANKGSLGGMAFRGRSRSEPRKRVDQGMIDRAGTTSYNYCGPTSAGFLLDFISKNELQPLPSWKSLGYKAKITDLENRMCMIRTWPITGATLPRNLGNAISYHTGGRYAVVEADGMAPTMSINNNLPGINLRTLKLTSWDDLMGGLHYRNVVAYDERGWWIFKWTYMKILDNNNVDADGWETYIPLYHWASYDLVRW